LYTVFFVVILKRNFAANNEGNLYMNNCPTVNLINILHTNFLYKYDVSAAFPNYVYVEKAAETMFVRKTCAYNVDEIDT